MLHPLNILTLSTLFPNANAPGFGIFVERQTAELNRRTEANVTVINPIGLPPWPLSLLSRYRPLRALPSHEIWNGLKVFRPSFSLLPGMGGSRNPARIFRAILPLIRQLHAENPFDLIDAEFFYPDGPVAMQISKALNIPYSIKARGADIHYWGAQSGCRQQILQAADKAAGLLAVSNALRDDMTELGMDRSKIEVHYTGLDQDKFRPIDRAAAKSRLGVSGPLFITAGALIARKNQALVIEAMTSFPAATLLLAGQGEEEAGYRKLAARLGVTERVRFLGSISHDALAELVAAADISILVSKSEGLANAWVEALSCGTPIIISQAGGARELLRTPAAGQIVDQNPAEIIKAIRSILADPPAQETVRAAVMDYSWEANGDQLIKLFTNLTSSNSVS
jgi:glycosyltransferase involved in cell wall biosynthesis